MHANKIRQFVAHGTRGVTAGKDAEFGRVLTPVPVVSSVLPSQRVDQDKLTHLSVSDESEFVPRQVRPYRVPAVFKDEVDRQIAELLSMGLIRRSNSPVASPIVCVAKKDGGVRIACDYRYLNTYTVGDAFPMATTVPANNRVTQVVRQGIPDRRTCHTESPSAIGAELVTRYDQEPLGSRAKMLP